MNNNKYVTQFVQFRQRLYQNFRKRADSAMDLLDALCSTPDARSVVELSLSPHFRRSHTALYTAIDEAGWDEIEVLSLVNSELPQPEKRGYWVLGVDGTPQRRQYAQTLSDRGYVYYPNAVAGNRPVTIGHEYSTVALLPEEGAQRASSWVVPLSVQRVRTKDDKELVGAKQIVALLDDEQAPWKDDLVVNVGDSRYSKPEYLHAVHQGHPNLVSVVRVRGDRTLYRYLERPETCAAHRPKYKGKAFKLSDPETHSPPSECLTLDIQGKRGQSLKVVIEGWSDMVMPGKNKPERIPMENYPFRLIRITWLDENEQPIFTKPMWLIVVGQRRGELSLQDILAAYAARSNLEHFFRFGKQKLLMDAFQTPETPNEEHWWRISHLAYLMLWMAHPLAEHLPRPWERYLPQHKHKRISPALVQRDFSRLISQVGTPARLSKPRGKSPGRSQGTRIPPRKRHPVVYKGQNQPAST